MGLIIWGTVLPACALAGWLVLRSPVRHFLENMQVDQARHHFRLHREWLEARFLSSLARVDPIERVRWEDAQWHDEVIWARDRQTRSFLALIGVHFEGIAFDGLGEPRPRHSTALFEYRKGRWSAEGKRIDEVRPDEAVLRHHRFEPLVSPPRPID